MGEMVCWQLALRLLGARSTERALLNLSWAGNGVTDAYRGGKTLVISPITQLIEDDADIDSRLRSVLDNVSLTLATGMPSGWSPSDAAQTVLLNPIR